MERAGPVTAITPPVLTLLRAVGVPVCCATRVYF